MYTRTYYQNEGDISLPKNYDGTAFKEEERNLTKEDESEQVSASAEAFGHSLFKKMPLGSLISSFNFLGNGEFKFGSEEIIIIALALFLFFTKEADKECGIMLLLLLLIK